MFSHIRRIDFEHQSYCNRLCDWCPNKTLNRQGHNEMPEETYIRFLNDLKDNGFGSKALFNHNVDIASNDYNYSSPIFCFSGYQEAFSDIDLFKQRVRQAYDILPNTVSLGVNTNGDFLTKESLENLPLNSINIMDYDNKGIEYWENKLVELGICVIDVNYDTEIITGIHRYVNMITCNCNWEKHFKIENRGGILDLQSKQRDFPCIEPSYFLTVHYDGSVMPCCHTREDFEQHKELIMGNINNQSIQEIYKSEKFMNFKKYMIEERGEYCKQCKYCTKSRYLKYDDSKEGFKYDGFDYLNKRR